MPATEELRVHIRTVADTTGARQTQAALTGVQQQATQAGRAVANASAGAGAGFRQSAQGVLQLGAAFGVATSASLAASSAIQLASSAIGTSIQTLRENERLVRATAAAYGAQAQNFERFAEALSTQTGFTSQAILQAALAARTLSANYGLTIQQTQRLITVSADLARIRGIGIAESFERIQSAIRGEAEASEYLGLTLNDTFIKNNAMNGSIRNTFETMTDAQKAQVRYVELLRQVAPFAGLAASATNSLDGAFGRLEVSANKAQLELGKAAAPATIFGLQAAANAMDLLATNSDEAVAALAGLSPILSGLGQLRDSYQNFPLVRRETEARAQATALNEELDLQRRILLAHNEAAVAAVRAQAAVQAAMQAAAARVVPAESLRQSDALIRQLTTDIALFGQRSQELGAILSALPLGDVLLRAGVQAQQAMQQIDAAVTARLAAAEKLRRARELESGATRIFDPRDAAGAEAARSRLGLMQQIEDAQRDVLDAQAASTALQRQSVQLSAQEAALRLSMLPAQQRMLELQRGVAEQQARARLAAMPATEALEDLRYLQERARLVAQSRDVPVEERVAARRSIRDLSRAEPRATLAALDAQRSLVPSQRAGERIGIEAQLADIQRQRQLAPVEILQQQNQHLSAIAAAITAQAEQRLLLRLEVSTDGSAPLVYQELIEANGQAHTPPVIQVSAVRRN